MTEINFPTQFSPRSCKRPIGRYSAPVEGFVPGQCESLSRMVQRLQAGQFVPVVSDGVYAQEQIFESEMVDRFDLLDRANEIIDKIGKERSRKAAEKKQDKVPDPPGTPTPE